MITLPQWLIAALGRQVTKIFRQQVHFSAHETFMDHCARHGLSHRQAEVVRLLLQGRTYAQIAAELFISRKTVDTHVQHVYAKLGVRNKLELLHKLCK